MAERVALAALGAPAPVREAVGRWAARENLLAHAQALVPEGAYGLARAGFFEQAAHHARPGEAAWLAAMAGLGRLDLVAEGLEGTPALDPSDRRWIAGLIATRDAEAALEVLEPSMAVERAACLLALGEAEVIAAILQPAVHSPERSLLLAAAAARLGNWKEARTGINAAFVARALQAPFRKPLETPITLAEFEPARVGARASGPLVSIVVPLRNGAAGLPVTLDSLLRQSWETLEVIVVDSGSTDGGAALARTRAEADSRVRVLSSDGPPGPGAARNRGVAAALGAYIGVHDAGDWAHPARITRQVEAIEAARGAAAVSMKFHLAADGRPVAPQVLPMVSLAPASLLARAGAVRAAGPWEDAPLGAEEEFLARMALVFGQRNVAQLDQIHVVTPASPGPTGAHDRAGRQAYERDWRARHAQMVRESLG